MNWMDELLREAAEDSVDDVIDKAMSGDAEGVGDTNVASDYVKDADVSDDPDKLTYDDNCYSQGVEASDTDIDGTIDTQIGDITTQVNRGAETSATEAALSADELRGIYTESVAKVIAASKNQINKVYKESVAAAKAKKIAAARKAKSVAEAADIDGANGWQQLINITVPLISPTIFFVLVTRIIGAMQVFDLIYMMIDLNNPAWKKTESLVFLFYKYSFEQSKKGYGATVIVVLLVLILILTIFQLIGQKKWVHYE